VHLCGGLEPAVGLEPDTNAITIKAAPFTSAARISNRSNRTSAPPSPAAVPVPSRRATDPARPRRPACGRVGQQGQRVASHPPTASATITAAVIASTIFIRAGSPRAAELDACIGLPAVPRRSPVPLLRPLPKIPGRSATGQHALCSRLYARPPGSESLGLRLLAVLALVLANAFFVAAEFALVAAAARASSARPARRSEGADGTGGVQRPVPPTVRGAARHHGRLDPAGYVAEIPWRSCSAIGSRRYLPRSSSSPAADRVHGRRWRWSPSSMSSSASRRQGVGHHPSRADQPLDRRAAHLLLVDHAPVYRPPQLER